LNNNGFFVLILKLQSTVLDEGIPGPNVDAEIRASNTPSGSGSPKAAAEVSLCNFYVCQLSLIQFD
jgi:hypothetical protein